MSQSYGTAVEQVNTSYVDYESEMALRYFYIHASHNHLNGCTFILMRLHFSSLPVQTETSQASFSPVYGSQPSSI